MRSNSDSKGLKQIMPLHECVQTNSSISSQSKQHDRESAKLAIHPMWSYTTESHVDELHCFCSSTFPVFQLTRLIGLNIISASHPRPRKISIPADNPNSLHAKYCHSASFCSFPSLCNVVFTTAYVYLTIWIYLHLKEHLGLFFQGVDYYTLAVDIVSNFVQAATLLLHARFKGKTFIRALHDMQVTYSCLKQQNPNFILPKSLKIVSIILVVFILSTTLVYGCLFLYLIFGMTIHYHSLSDSKHEWMSVPFIIQKFGHFFLPIYHQSFVAMFIVCTGIIRQLYIQLARQLQLYLTNISTITRRESRTTQNAPNAMQNVNPSKLADEIESCRLLHERLFKTVGSLSDYFGGSLLVVCSVAVLSVTAAVYTIILNKSDPGIVDNTSHKDIVDFFFVVWGFHLFFAIFVLAGVLYSGQRVTCASRLIARVIQETSLKNVDKESQFQVNLLAQAVYGEPVEISACNITKMSMTFVASAVGNVITYILVLLQFKWSCYDKVKS